MGSSQCAGSSKDISIFLGQPVEEFDERFFAGDPFLLMASRFLSYDRSAAVARVKAMLARSYKDTEK